VKPCGPAPSGMTSRTPAAYRHRTAIASDFSQIVRSASERYGTTVLRGIAYAICDVDRSNLMRLREFQKILRARNYPSGLFTYVGDAGFALPKNDKEQNAVRQTTLRSTGSSQSVSVFVHRRLSNKELILVDICGHGHIEKTHHHLVVGLIAPVNGRCRIGIMRIAFRIVEPGHGL
jgi:hypothetical protein